MPNVHSSALTAIQSIGVSILPYVLLAVAIFLLGMASWWIKQKGNVTRQQWLQEAAREAVAAAEQAVAAADKDGKFALASALLQQTAGKLPDKQVAALIESAVAALKLLPTIDSGVATRTSNSVLPILAQLGRPTAAQRVGAEGEAILRAVRDDMDTLKVDVGDLRDRLQAAEQAIRTPQAPAAGATKTASSGKDAAVTDTPVAHPHPDPAASPQSAAPPHP